MRVIALEEHFTTDALVSYTAPSAAFMAADVFPAMTADLLADDETRLARMDADGIDVQVLSLTVPGVQAEPDARRAVDLARAANDVLAERTRRHPTRFAGFCALPLQHPDAAVAEFERCVTDLGMVGALVNGHTLGRYLDEPEFDGVWRQAVALKAPVYLHPSNPPDRWQHLHGHPELLGPVWAFGAETAAHALRIVFAGTFDRHPAATLILGHMGECLPFMLWRLDSRWRVIRHHGRELDHPPSFYVRNNISITTSGVASDAPLLGALLAVGPERIMFAVDTPYEEPAEAIAFLRHAPVSTEVRNKIAHGNAERLLRIAPAR